MGYIIFFPQELFSEIGELKRYSVNYDKDGKSQVDHGVLSCLFLYIAQIYSLFSFF